MELYETLLLVHILAALVWVGGGFMLVLLAYRAERAEDEVAMAYVVGQGDKLANKVFVPAAVTTLVMGILLTIDGPWSFGDLWIVLALAGYFAGFVLGAFFLGPLSARIAGQVEQDGGYTSATLAQSRRLLTLSRIDYVNFFLIIVVMVVKPTGDDVGLLAAMALVLAAGIALTLARLRALEGGGAPAAATP